MTSKLTAVPLWLRYLPPTLRNRIVDRPNLVKILSNIGWLFSDTLLRACIGLIVGVWLARYLGPEQFGLLNYALAFVSLFSAFATMGLQDIVVRELVKNRSCAAEILGTSFCLRLIGGAAAFVLVIASVGYLKSGDSYSVAIVTIIGITLVFQSSEVVKYWFESQVLSKYSVWAQNSIFLVCALVKICLILAKAPLLAFIWFVSVEALLVAMALFSIYLWKGGKLSLWRVKLKRALSLLRDSWPLMLSALAITVYMRIDQIMLGELLDNEAVGLYSAAVRISELWYFIPMAIVASVFPAILEVKKKSEKLYLDRLQNLYDLMVLLALAVALPMTFLSGWIVQTLFGASYAEAGTVLAIHVWAALFVFLGVASSRWFIAENRQVLSLQRTLIGAIANVALNFLLIPGHGIYGAAYATVISYAIAGLFADALQQETRSMFMMKIRAFNSLRLAKNMIANKA